MRCATALSMRLGTDSAFAEVRDRLALTFPATAPADLAVLFVTPQHAGRLGALADDLRARGLVRHLIGVTGESVLADGVEIEGEREAGVAVWAASLPGVSLQPIRMTADERGLEAFHAAVGDGPHDHRVFLAFGDPFTFPVDAFLSRVNTECPGLRVVGGMASAGQGTGQNRLVLDDDLYEEGAIGVLIDGPVALRTIVSQGCRPVGRPLLVTKATDNLIRELGRRPALEVFQETFGSLDPHEQELVRRGLHVGRVINEYQESFAHGDFLVRNVLGADEQGAIAITDRVRVGQTVQFHVRDADTATEDLRALLTSASGTSPAAGALVFTCNGRGSRLFEVPHHDAALVQALVGPLPAAGFFAMGEIGPIGGQNFVHGFSASILLFGETPHA
jgi:small ligand-binding sensory domain FIST